MNLSSAARAPAPKGRRLLLRPLTGRLALGLVAGTLLIVLLTVAQGYFGPAAGGERPKTPARAEGGAAPASRPEPARPTNLLAESPDAKPAAPAPGKPAPAAKGRAPADAAPAISPLKPLMAVAGAGLALALLVFGLLRWMRRARLVPDGQRCLRLVDALPLGPKRFVYAVGWRDRLLLVAAGPDDTTLLAEYSEDDAKAAAPEERAAPRAESAAAAPERSSNGHAPDAASPDPAADRPAGSVIDVVDTAAKAATRPRPRPHPGAHRVPPAFRHLLEQTLGEEAAPR